MQCVPVSKCHITTEEFDYYEITLEKEKRKHMNLLSSALLVLFDFIIFTKAEKCRCLDKKECFPHLTNVDLDFMKNFCFGGCEPGWEGLTCDRVRKTRTPCHCSSKHDCQLSQCTSCEYGWYGLLCDKNRRNTIYRNTGNSHDSHWKAWNVFGYSLIGIVIIIIFCCCFCTGVKHKNRQESSQTPASRRDPMWSTESSGGSQTYNLNRNIEYPVSNTDMIHSHNVQSIPFEPHSGSAPFSEPPPSYEFIMSQESNGLPKSCNVQESTENQ